MDRPTAFFHLAHDIRVAHCSDKAHAISMLSSTLCAIATDPDPLFLLDVGSEHGLVACNKIVFRHTMEGQFPNDMHII